MNQEKPFQTLPVLFQNEDCAFIEKPAGLLMYWTLGVKDTEFMLQKVRNQLGKLVFPVQRLDRGTSGIVGFGLSKQGAGKLQRALQSSDTRKYYIALVRGKLVGNGIVDAPLKSPKRGIQSALTLYRVLESCDYCTLVQVEIITGRFHQIRKHLSSIGHPVIGDFIDGKSMTNNLYREKYQLSRPFLHASCLDFGTAEGFPSRISCNLPADLSLPLAKIGAEFGFSTHGPALAELPSKLEPFDERLRTETIRKFNDKRLESE